MTFEQHRDWCARCAQVGCICPICHSPAGLLRGAGPYAVEIACPNCRPAPEPATPARAERPARRGWADER